MGEDRNAYIREIDPRLVRLARTLNDRDLEVLCGFAGESVANCEEHVESRP